MSILSAWFLLRINKSTIFETFNLQNTVRSIKTVVFP